MNEIRKGDRVRLTEKAKRLRVYSQHTDRIGTAASNAGHDYVVVRWDGNKSRTTLHCSFVERIPNDEPLQPDIAARFAHVEITDA